ncbi:IPT/TIG domain-containing protein [Hymenobacter baengnokdamensis]|uniref:IPT/TIG domain-containing protein n=1 Tax=Hymenobacter baengnokdamensis TaxID=2615203 RepID=UPI00178335C1|nr:IPT/TIG domain-containing protein [Hymenobacter baengnokdamensis]
MVPLYNYAQLAARSLSTFRTRFVLGASLWLLAWAGALPGAAIARVEASVPTVLPALAAAAHPARLTASAGPLTLVGSSTTATTSPVSSNSPTSVAVVGNYAYVLNSKGGTNGGAILAFDISTPAAPALASVTALPDNTYPHYLAAAGNLVTVLNLNEQYGRNGVQVSTLATYDATTPTTALPQLSSINIPGNNVAGLGMTGTTAYTLSDNFGGGAGTVAVVDLSAPASPVLRQNSSTGHYTPTAFAVNGSVALAASSSYAPVNVMTLTPTTAPKRGEVLVGTDIYPNSNRAVAVGSTLGAVLNFNTPSAPLLQVLNISSPTPVLKGSLTLDASAGVLTMVDDHFGYVLNQGSVNTLQVLDFSNPNAPFSVGSISTSATPAGLTVVGSYAYVTCNDNTLRIFKLALAPALTAISPGAELPGATITLTGTNFAATSSVSFGGVAATNVVFNSSTSLTVTVPGSLAAGSSSVVVGTSSGVSASAPAFTVLNVYTPSLLATCASVVPATASTNDGQWHYLLTASGEVVLAYSYTGASLGNLAVDMLAADPAAPVRQDAKGRKYLDRNFHLTASGGRFDGRTVALRFFGLNSEFARLQAADPTVTLASLHATQYSGPNEDCDLSNNSATGEFRALSAPASIPSGAPWFVANVTVADHFSEFYLTGSSSPLPVELVSFTATIQRAATVQLSWTTATELNNDYFVVERSRDGQLFSQIGQVAGAGSSALPHTYALTDAALPAGSPVVYYRLRQVDIGGRVAYSPVRAVEPGFWPGGLQVSPNPAAAQLTVTGIAAQAAVEVYNVTGQLVQRASADASGTGQVSLPAGLPAGVYLVRSGTQAQRIVVE